MSFAFNPNDTFNDIPNPYRFESVFLAVAANSAIAGGIAAIMNARELVGAQKDGIALIAAAVAVLTLGFAVKLLLRALRKMRFYLGRNFPRSLAGELPVHAIGVSDGVDKIMDTIRQQAIEFEETQSATESVLCFMVKDLATAPMEIRTAVVRNVHTLISVELYYPPYLSLTSPSERLRMKPSRPGYNYP